MGRNVYIVEGNAQYVGMFARNGWGVVDDITKADLVQFTGGSDVDPDRYGEAKHPYTSIHKARDAQEERIFTLAMNLGKAVAGICRGGQFLNVMCGGSLYQHVNNHAIHGTHNAINLESGVVIPVTSTHHQMMRAGAFGEVVGVASEATMCENMEGGAIAYHEQQRGEDVEVVYYKEENVLCFQPHPEYLEVDSACQQWYFSLVNSMMESSICVD